MNYCVKIYFLSFDGKKTLIVDVFDVDKEVLLKIFDVYGSANFEIIVHSFDFDTGREISELKGE